MARDAWVTNGGRRQRVSATVRARGEACCICRQPIDYSLAWPNPLSFSVQHMQPRALRPDLMFDLANLRAAHLQCNQSLGADVAIREWETSRRW